MRVLIWGAGAIGGTVGAYLARAGHDITWVDREAKHVAAINEHGLAITGPIEEFTAHASALTPEQVQGAFSTIFLCTKAHHTEEACRTLAPHLAENGIVVSLQNGLNEQVIAGIVGEQRTLGAFINFGADYLAPGVIHYGGRGAVVVGELDGSTTPRLKQIHEVLLDFEEKAQISQNIWGFLWSKLAVGAMLFATALTDASIADAFASSRHQDLFLAIPREVLAIAQAHGVTPEPFDGFDPQAFLPSATPETSRRSLAEMEAFNRRSAKTHSGIWRDLAVRKRKTEVDEQLGPILTHAAEAGQEAPLVAKIIDLIHDIEAGKRGRDWDNLDILLKLAPSSG